MTRREFLRHVALMAAATAALPDQLDAFTRYYTLNAPPGQTGLMMVDEIFMSGVAQVSTPVTAAFFRTDPGKPVLNLGFNAFGGLVRWVAAPDQKIICRSGEFQWDLRLYSDPDYDLSRSVIGHILYMDQDGIRRTAHVTPKGRLSAPGTALQTQLPPSARRRWFNDFTDED